MAFILNKITINPMFPVTEGPIRVIGSHTPKEIIPPWENKNKWQGFSTLFHAVTVSASHNYPCAIVDVGARTELMGYGNAFCNNYRVFEINKIKKFSVPRHFTITCFQSGVRLMHFIQRPKGNWVDYIDKISFSDFKELIVRYTGLREDEIDVFQSHVKYFEKGGDTRINFIYMQPDPNPNNYLPSSTKPFEFDESLKDPSLTPKVKIFIQKSYNDKSELFMETTIVHECIHRIHFLRALALIKIWRKSKIKSNFFQWVSKLAENKKLSKNDLLIIESSLTIIDDSRTKISEKEKISRLFSSKAFELIQSSEILHIYPYLEGFKLKVWLADKNEILKIILKNKRDRSKNQNFQNQHYPVPFHLKDLYAIDDCYGINARPNWVKARKGHKAIAEEVCAEIVNVFANLKLDKRLRDEIKEEVKYSSENRPAGTIEGRLSQNPGAFLKILYPKLIKAI